MGLVKDDVTGCYKVSCDCPCDDCNSFQTTPSGDFVASVQYVKDMGWKQDDSFRWLCPRCKKHAERTP